MKKPLKTKFYTFRQNNSGGSFDIDIKNGINEYVIIEALDYKHANGIAQSVGIYFDGCNNNIDCPCCGDRWCKKDDESDGYDYPGIYGENDINNEEYKGKYCIHYLRN